jgi:hypothetical protein
VAEVAELPLADIGRVSRPDRSDAVVGVNETCIEQAAAGASVVLHRLFTLNPLLAVGCPSVTGAPPVFNTLTVALTLDPRIAEPKVTGLGLSTSAPAVTPVPASVAAAGLPAKLPGKLSEPAIEPAATGENCTRSEHDETAARLAPHWFVTRLKPLPVRTGVPRLTGTPPGLLAVNKTVDGVVPRMTLPSAAVDGLITRLPGTAPAPARLTCKTGGLPSLSKASVPERSPARVGVKVIATVQLAPEVNEVAAAQVPPVTA